MGRYEDSRQAIFSIFGSLNWQFEDIKTIPSDFIATDIGDEYIRVTVIPSGKGLTVNSISGICIIDIFTAHGNGPKRYMEIADKLDNYLLTKTVSITPSKNVQFGESSLSPRGQDKDNISLNRAQYTIPFNLFGV